MIQTWVPGVRQHGLIFGRMGYGSGDTIAEHGRSRWCGYVSVHGVGFGAGYNDGRGALWIYTPVLFPE